MKFNGLVIHFLFVIWEFLITEWFFSAICYGSIKQIIYSQITKITKKRENRRIVTSASCTISTKEETNPLWKHLYLKSLQDSCFWWHRLALQLEKGDSSELWKCCRMWGWWVADSGLVMAPVQHLHLIDSAVIHVCVMQSPCCWIAPGTEYNYSFDLSGDVVCFKHILKNKSGP